MEIIKVLCTSIVLSEVLQATFFQRTKNHDENNLLLLIRNYTTDFFCSVGFAFYNYNMLYN